MSNTLISDFNYAASNLYTIQRYEKMEADKKQIECELAVKRGHLVIIETKPSSLLGKIWRQFQIFIGYLKTAPEEIKKVKDRATSLTKDVEIQRLIAHILDPKDLATQVLYAKHRHEVTKDVSVTLQKKIDDKTGEIRELERKLEEANKKLQTAFSSQTLEDVTNLKALINKMEISTKELNSKIEENEQTIVSLNKTISDLKDSLKETEENRSQLFNEYTDLKEKMLAVETSQAGLVGQSSSQEKEIEELKKTLSQLETSKNELHANNTATTIELNHANFEIKKRDKEIDELKEKLKQFERLGKRDFKSELDDPESDSDLSEKSPEPDEAQGKAIPNSIDT